MTELHANDDLICVAIVEDNRYVRSGWEMALKNVPDFELVGSYASCEEAFRSETIGDADVVLMDIGLPGMSGIDGVKHLKQKYHRQAIVMCTIHDDDERVFGALCAGADGYLLKKTPPDELVKALREAHSGGSPMTPSVARKVIASFQKPVSRGNLTLTEREQQVLDLMAQGKSYATIANELFLSVDGVYYHIRHIYEKLQVHTRGEAMAQGLKKRLILPPR